MLGYYLILALRSLRHHLALSILMVVVVAVGIGASMTTLTIFRAMSGNPIPRKSTRLFTVQIDNHGPNVPDAFKGNRIDQLPIALTYIDAVALMRAYAAPRQAAMYETSAAVTPPDPRQLPFTVPVRATYADFFPMFDVPFEYGAPWSAAEDQAHASVVVIGRRLNDKLFGGGNSVGKVLSVGLRSYRIAGVIGDWNPVPRFYDLTGIGGFSAPEQLFLPFTTAVDRGLPQDHYLRCLKSSGAHLLQSECVWVQFWAELPTAAAVRNYRAFLVHYATEQRRGGRFDWLPRVALRDVGQWLDYNRVVSSDVTLLVVVSFAFLLVCLLNATGLMLARFMRRAAQVRIRRALGANRGALFAQSLVEAAVVGLAGGIAGLGLSVLGLIVAGELFPPGAAALTRLDVPDALIAIALGISATLFAGLYPTWRVVRMPMSQLKAQ